MNQKKTRKLETKRQIGYYECKKVGHFKTKTIKKLV